MRIHINSYKSIKTTEDCYVLLYNGYTLENITGGIVMFNGCTQITTQRNIKIKRTLPYKFNHPRYWFVIDDKGQPINVEITKWMRIKAFIKENLCDLIGGLKYERY